MADEISIVVNAVDNFSSVLGNFGSIMTGVESTINMVAGAMRDVWDFTSQFVDAASGSELAVTRLNTVLSSTGDQLGRSTEYFQKLATGMQNMTGNSDEAEMAAEAMLLRFENLNAVVFPQALQLTNDLSASLGIDLTTAARMVGMALDDPTQGIGRLNTAYRIFDDSQMEVIKNMAATGDLAGAQALIIQALTEKFGGAAAAIGQTFAGQLDIAKEKIDNLKELIGGPLLTVLTGMLEKFNEIADSPQVIQFFTDLGNAIGQMATGDFSGIDAFLGNLFQHMADAVNAWVTGGGADELSNELVSWIANLGVGTTFDSRAATAAFNLVAAIGRAFGAVRWDDVLTAMDNSLSQAVEQYPWQQAGNSFGQAIERFFSSGTNAGLSSSSQNFISTVGQALNSWLLGAVGAVSWQQWANAARDNINTYLLIPIADALSSFADTLVYILFPMRLGTDLARAARTAFLNIGTEIQAGISQGLTSIGLDWWVQWWDDHIVAPVKAFLGISSPSTLFAGIGADIVRGLINGIEGMANWALSAITSWLADVLAPFKAVLDFLGIDTSAIFGGSSGGTTGSHDTGGVTTPPGGTTSSVTGATSVTFNFYGTTYINGVPTDGQYDCPPNIVVDGTSSQLVLHAL